MRKTQLEQFRKTLEDRLTELYRAAHAQVRDMMTADRAGDARDEADWAQESQDDGLRQGLAEGEAAIAQQIEEALRRITRGEYGICVDCGNPIELARLRAVPWALRDADCQQAWESDHASRPSTL